MEKTVVIMLIVAACVSWIAYLVYTYHIFSLRLEANGDVYKNKYFRLQNAVVDFIGTLNDKFPGSTLEYNSKENTEEIRGNIKYKE